MVRSENTSLVNNDSCLYRKHDLLSVGVFDPITHDNQDILLFIITSTWYDNVIKLH